MYNFSALWLRVVFLVVIALLLVFILLVFGKRFKLYERLITVAVAIALIILGGGFTLKSAINPKIKTVVGYYESEKRAAFSLSPFETEYTFVCGNKTYYLGLDPFSKSKIFSGEFAKGKEYTVSYEESSDLIVAISEND